MLSQASTRCSSRHFTRSHYIRYNALAAALSRSSVQHASSAQEKHFSHSSYMSFQQNHESGYERSDVSSTHKPHKRRKPNAAGNFRDDGFYQPLPRRELRDPRQLVALIKGEVQRSRRSPQDPVLARFEEFKDTSLFNPIVAAAMFNFMAKSLSLRAVAKDPRFFDLVDHVTRMMHEKPTAFPPRAISLILHATSRILKEPDDRASLLMQRGADLLVAALQHAPGRIDPRAAVNAMYAFGQWHWAYEPLFDSAAEFLLSRVNHLSSQGLVLTLYSCGRTRYRHPDLFHAVTTRIAMQLHSCSTQGLALMLWSHVRTRQRPDALFAWQVANESMTRMGEYEPVSLANVTWSTARLGIHYGRLFQGFAQRALTLVKKLRPRELSTLALAFAAVRHTGVDSDSVVNMLIAQSVRGRSHAKSLDLASILCASTMTSAPDVRLCDVLLHRVTDLTGQNYGLVGRWVDETTSQETQTSNYTRGHGSDPGYESSLDTYTPTKRAVSAENLSPIQAKTSIMREDVLRHHLTEMQQLSHDTARSSALSRHSRNYKKSIHTPGAESRTALSDLRTSSLSEINNSQTIGTSGTLLEGVSLVNEAHAVLYDRSAAAQSALDTFLRMCNIYDFDKYRGVLFTSRPHEVAAIAFGTARARCFQSSQDLAEWYMAIHRMQRSAAMAHGATTGVDTSLNLSLGAREARDMPKNGSASLKLHLPPHMRSKSSFTSDDLDGGHCKHELSQNSSSGSYALPSVQDFILHPSRIRLPYHDAIIRSTHAKLPQSLDVRERASVMDPSVHVTRFMYGFASAALFRDALARGDISELITFPVPVSRELLSREYAEVYDRERSAISRWANSTAESEDGNSRSLPINLALYRMEQPLWISERERQIFLELADMIRSLACPESTEQRPGPDEATIGLEEALLEETSRVDADELQTPSYHKFLSNFGPNVSFQEASENEWAGVSDAALFSDVEMPSGSDSSSAASDEELFAMRRHSRNASYASKSRSEKQHLSLDPVEMVTQRALDGNNAAELFASTDSDIEVSHNDDDTSCDLRRAQKPIMEEIRPQAKNRSDVVGPEIFTPSQALLVLYTFAACGIWDEQVFRSLWPRVQSRIRVHDSSGRVLVRTASVEDLVQHDRLMPSFHQINKSQYADTVSVATSRVVFGPDGVIQTPWTSVEREYQPQIRLQTRKDPKNISDTSQDKDRSSSSRGIQDKTSTDFVARARRAVGSAMESMGLPTRTFSSISAAEQQNWFLPIPSYTPATGTSIVSSSVMDRYTRTFHTAPRVHRGSRDTGDSEDDGHIRDRMTGISSVSVSHDELGFPATVYSTHTSSNTPSVVEKLFASRYNADHEVSPSTAASNKFSTEMEQGSVQFNRASRQISSNLSFLLKRLEDSRIPTTSDSSVEDEDHLEIISDSIESITLNDRNDASAQDVSVWQNEESEVEGDSAASSMWWKDHDTFSYQPQSHKTSDSGSMFQHTTPEVNDALLKDSSNFQQKSENMSLNGSKTDPADYFVYESTQKDMALTSTPIESDEVLLARIRHWIKTKSPFPDLFDQMDMETSLSGSESPKSNTAGCNILVNKEYLGAEDAGTTRALLSSNVVSKRLDFVAANDSVILRGVQPAELGYGRSK